MKDVQVEYDHPISIFCQNTSAISISKNLVTHSKTKHIPKKYHFVREHVAENIVKLEYVDTKDKMLNLCGVIDVRGKNVEPLCYH